MAIILDLTVMVITIHTIITIITMSLTIGEEGIRTITGLKIEEDQVMPPQEVHTAVPKPHVE